MGLEKPLLGIKNRGIFNQRHSMVQNITGIRRVLFEIYIRLVVVIHVTGQLVQRSIAFNQYGAVLWRLEHFLRKMGENKFVSIDGKTRIGG